MGIGKVKKTPKLQSTVRREKWDGRLVPALGHSYEDSGGYLIAD